MEVPGPVQTSEVEILILLQAYKVQFDIPEVLSDRHIYGTYSINIFSCGIRSIFIKHADHGEVLGSDCKMHGSVPRGVPRIRIRLILEQKPGIVIVIGKDSEMQGRCSILLVAYLVHKFTTGLQNVFQAL